MNVEIGAEAALFPENEYISGIFVAVRYRSRGIFFIQRLDWSDAGKSGIPAFFIPLDGCIHWCKNLWMAVKMLFR